MWYQRLNAFWDGSDYLALISSAPRSASRSTEPDVYVRSGRTSTDALRLSAVLQWRAGNGSRVVRLPDEHRFVTLSLAPSQQPLFEISLEQKIEQSNAEWCLALLEVANDGQLRLEVDQQSVRTELGKFLGERLGRLRERRRDSVVVWGGVCRERRTFVADQKNARTQLAITPVAAAFPESAHTAPIEIEATVLRRHVSAQTHDMQHPDRPSLPSIIEAEAAGLPRYGLRLRTSREDPTVRWVQQRCAIVNLRRQVHFFETSLTSGLTAVGYVSTPFDRADLEAIGDLSEIPESIITEVPVDDPTIRTCSLLEVLTGRGQPMQGISVEEASDLGVLGPSDQTTIWLERAVLGDYFGLVSTQPGALKPLAPAGKEAGATEIALFRVTTNGLEPADLSGDEQDIVVSSAAAVQPHDSDVEFAPPSDQQMQSIEIARQRMYDRLVGLLGGRPRISFDKLGPVLAVAAIDQLNLNPAAAEQGAALAAFEIGQNDPSLFSLLAARDFDTRRLADIARLPQNAGDDLLQRIARANEASGAVAAGGVQPASDVEALEILMDADLLGRMRDAKVALDASGNNLRHRLDEALASLSDRPALASLLDSLRAIESGADDAKAIAAYLDGDWIELAEALVLAHQVQQRRSQLTQTDQIIDGMLIDGGSTSGATGTGRHVKAIREAIRKIFSVHGTEPAIADIENRIVLEELDHAQASRLLSKLATLIHGPAREALIEKLLGRLEEWAHLNGFFVRLAESQQGEARLSGNIKRRDGAKLLKNRVEKLRTWAIPADEGRDTFSGERARLRSKLEKHWQSETINVEGTDDDFEGLVAPVADLLLHHRAFRTLREISDRASSQEFGDEESSLKMDERRLARGLATWPRGADSTWNAGKNLARNQGASQSLNNVLAHPKLT